MGWAALDCYISGLLSALDSLFNEPLTALVEPLPLDSRFKAALLRREGQLGAVLRCVDEYESGEWTAGPGTPAVAEMHEAFWDAASYARDMIKQLTGVRLG
jgi:c-di-GMP-related signal transduction protein